MKTITNIQYYVALGLYLSMSELLKKFKELEIMLNKLFDDNTLPDYIVDLAYEGGGKDELDMKLKSLDIVVFDETKDKPDTKEEK